MYYDTAEEIEAAEYLGWTAIGAEVDPSAALSAASAASPLAWIAPVLSAAGQLAQGGIDYADRQRAESERAKSEEEALAQGTATDRAAIDALQALATAKADGKTAQLPALELASSMALEAVDRAPGSKPKRVEALRALAAASTKALRAAQASTKQGSPYFVDLAGRRLQAIATVVRRVEQGPPPPPQVAPLVVKKIDDDSFLSRRVAGPVRVWHLGLGLAAVGLGVLVGSR